MKNYINMIGCIVIALCMVYVLPMVCAIVVWEIDVGHVESDGNTAFTSNYFSYNLGLRPVSNKENMITGDGHHVVTMVRFYPDRLTNQSEMARFDPGLGGGKFVHTDDAMMIRAIVDRSSGSTIYFASYS